MNNLNSQNAIHKAWLYRVLTAIVDDANLSDLRFKGGTCAVMIGILDRFSVDLDFDYIGGQSGLAKTRQKLEKIFKDLGLEIKDSSTKVPQFFLKYTSKNASDRHTLKVDVNFPPPQANVYEPLRLVAIDRIVICQNIPTMFANKLVAITDRFDHNGSIAGRDIYDVHHFFLNSYDYNKDVISERTGLKLIDFFKKLRDFINEHVTETILNQDLNPLIPYEQFKKIRKVLKKETLMFLDSEIEQIKLED
jgi:predicted nucleotidyltransferase component of viral defense system